MSTNESFGLATGIDLDKTYDRHREQIRSAIHTDSEDELTASQRELLRQLKEAKKKTECFGGVLFTRMGSTNQPIISFAVRGMTEDEKTGAERAYDELYRSYPRGIIYPANPFVEQAPPYTVFNFLVKSYCESLREYCCKKGSQTIPAEKTMRKLVTMLVENFNNAAGEYRAMNCLSLDTIFVDEQNKLWILPLQAFRGNFSREIAPEARESSLGCDATADLYAAAYVSLELANGGKFPEMLHVENAVIRDCLMGIRQCRPKLEVVAASFAGGRENVDTDGGGSSRGGRWQSSNIQPVENPEPKPRFDILAWFSTCWERMKAALSKAIYREPAEHVSGTKHDFVRKPFRPIKPLQDEEDDA